MSDRLSKALALAVAGLILFGSGLIVFAATAFLGVAWGILAVQAVVAVYFWLGGQAGMNGGPAVVILGAVAAGVGLLIGIAVRVLT